MSARATYLIVIAGCACSLASAGEQDGLSTFRWLAFSGHYDYPYHRYLRERIAKGVGGRICHEDFGALERIYTAQTQATWHTRCDWEWRLRQELDGSIKDLPLLKEWLSRVRGHVQGEERG